MDFESSLMTSIKNTIQQQNHIENLQKTINKIQNSITWKILRKYDKIIGKSRTKKN